MSMFDLIGEGVLTAAQIGGSLLASSAAKSASKSEIKALKQANAIRQQAIDRATAIYGDLRAQAAPAVSYLQGVVANPAGGLYPDQVAAQENARRQALNDVARSGLRGSGRAVTASLRNVDADFLNTALAQNRAARQNAAGTLAGPYFQAGNSTANALVSAGNDAAGTAEQVGATDAKAGLASANATGSALSDIGSLIASEIKGSDFKGRGSSYDGVDIPLRSPSGGTVNQQTGMFGHLAKGGIVTTRPLSHQMRAMLRGRGDAGRAAR